VVPSVITPGIVIRNLTDWWISNRSGQDTAQRRELVWQIERMLAEELVRPVIFYTRAAICWLPQVKGLTIMVNSLFNGWRFEDIWLDN